MVSIKAKNGSFEWFREAFPKLEELKIENTVYSNDLLSIRFNSLKKLDVFITDISESPETFEKNFKQFIENNKRLTHLTILLYLNNENLLDSVFKYILQLDQLVYLNIGGHQLSIMDIIVNLRQLSDKCLKIKSLCLCSSVYRYNNIESLDQLKSLMTEVNKFKALERLGFRLNLEDYEHLKLFEEYFNGLQSLTHLTIIYNNRMAKDLLKDIDIYLPKLRVLCVTYAPIEVSEQTVNSLARLSRLESLRFNVNNESIRDLIIDKITKNCTKIKSFYIKVYKS